MTILELKFTSDASQQVTTQLGAIKYLFDVRYNERTGVWNMSLSDAASRVLILANLALVLGCDVLAPFQLGIGSIIVNDEDGTGLDAGPDDLGDRVKVYWISPDD